MPRWRLLAIAAFFVTYLLVQAVYPLLSWFDPRFHWFAWNMYTGRAEIPQFEVVFEDGSTRRLPRLTTPRSPARVFSGSVHQARFVPPHLCARWPNVREVRVRYPLARRELVTPCSAIP